MDYQQLDFIPTMQARPDQRKLAHKLLSGYYFLSGGLLVFMGIMLMLVGWFVAIPSLYTLLPGIAIWAMGIALIIAGAITIVLGMFIWKKRKLAYLILWVFQAITLFSAIVSFSLGSIIWEGIVFFAFLYVWPLIRDAPQQRFMQRPEYI